MKLTMFEEVTLMKRACNIHGCGVTELKAILNSKMRSDSSKADAIAKTFAKLKAMQITKKTEVRSDKESKSLAKVLAQKLTPLEEYVAQSKNPEEIQKSSWVRTIFNKGAVTHAEAIALLSNSAISSMKAVDPFAVQKAQLHCDEAIKRIALVFCKRFNLI
jgi:hypothetical protein